MRTALDDLIDWRLTGFDQPQRPGFLRREPRPLAALKQDIDSLLGTEDEQNWRIVIRRIGDAPEAETITWHLSQLKVHVAEGIIIGVVKSSPRLTRHVYAMPSIERIEMRNVQAA